MAPWRRRRSKTADDIRGVPGSGGVRRAGADLRDARGAGSCRGGAAVDGTRRTVSCETPYLLGGAARIPPVACPIPTCSRPGFRRGDGRAPDHATASSDGGTAESTKRGAASHAMRRDVSALISTAPTSGSSRPPHHVHPVGVDRNREGAALAADLLGREFAVPRQPLPPPPAIPAARRRSTARTRTAWPRSRAWRPGSWSLWKRSPAPRDRRPASHYQRGLVPGWPWVGVRAGASHSASWRSSSVRRSSVARPLLSAWFHKRTPLPAMPSFR